MIAPIAVQFFIHLFNIYWTACFDDDGDGDASSCLATADGTRRSPPIRRRRACSPPSAISTSPWCPCAGPRPDGDDDGGGVVREHVSETRPTAGVSSPTPVYSTGSVRPGSRIRTSPARLPCSYLAMPGDGSVWHCDSCKMTKHELHNIGYDIFWPMDQDPVSRSGMP